MNICIITSSFPSSAGDVGQAPFLIEFIEGLKRRGHAVFVFTQDREGTKEEFIEGVRVKWFRWMGARRPLVHLCLADPIDWLRIISLLRRGKEELIPYLREHSIDACLGLWVLPGGYFAHYAWRKTGIPYSVWALGSDIYRYGENPFLYRVMKRILQEAKSVYADGFDLIRRLNGRFGARSSFLATARRLQPQLPSQPRRVENLPHPHPDPFLEGEGGRVYEFLYVGRLERVKGIDLLVESMARLEEEGIEGAHLTIAGGGNLAEWVRNYVAARGLGSKITLLDHVSDETLVSLYASSDCVVIPSRSESIPLVFSEALSFDREMIVTNVGDMGILGRDYGVADVIPPEDPGRLKGMMAEKIRKRGRRETRNEEKKSELKRLFSMETSVERFLADYE